MESVKPVQSTSTISSVKELKAKLAEAKRNVSRLERELVRAEKLEKEAQEAKRARKIKELLETNKGKTAIVEFSWNEMRVFEIKDIIVAQNKNNCWYISQRTEEIGWESSLNEVVRIYVEAEI